MLTCEAVVRRMAHGGNDPTHRLYGIADRVAEFILRSYRQTTEPAVRSRCLDIIDGLLAQEAYGITEELEKFER